MRNCLYFVQIVKWLIMIYLIVDGYNRMQMLFLVGREQFIQKHNIIILRWLMHKTKVKAF